MTRSLASTARAPRVLGAALGMCGALFVAVTAGAQDDAPPAGGAVDAGGEARGADAGIPDLALPLEPAAPLDPSLMPAKPAAPRFPQFFLFGNGLALLISSLSFGLEVLPVAHHSLGLNVHGQYGGIVGQALKITDIEPHEKGVFVGAGAELGYRFYGSREGPFGPFFGLSFLGGFYHAQDSLTDFGPSANSINYFQYGPAADIGYSFRLDKTTVVALSLGAQYTFITVDGDRLAALTELLVGHGLRPRGGIQVGKVF